MEPFTIDVGFAGQRRPVSAAWYAADPEPSSRPRAAFLFAHGAGAPHTHPFMVGVARSIARAGVSVMTFNFAYFEAGRRMPDRPPALLSTFERAYEAFRVRAAGGAGDGASRVALFAGGKSMGGRIASLASAAGTIAPAGLALFGYPLHPAGKDRSDEARKVHLARISCPLLFLQGTKDPFATPHELAGLASELPSASLSLLEGGDHSFSLPKSRKVAPEEIYDELARRFARWASPLALSAATRHVG